MVSRLGWPNLAPAPVAPLWSADLCRSRSAALQRVDLPGVASEAFQVPKLGGKMAGIWWAKSLE